VYGGPITGPRSNHLPIRTNRVFDEKPSESIRNLILTSLSGYQPAMMLTACWMLWARTDTQSRALPLLAPTETFTTWLTAFLFSNLLILESGDTSTKSLWIRPYQRLVVIKTNSS
jgi:hypothetical protein